MGVVTICTCIGFGFIGTRCQTGYYDFYLSGYENGRPSYLGTIMSVEYKVFWDGTQWGFQQTDPSFPEIGFFSTVDTFNICELIGSDWQIGDITNFPAICTILSSLDVVLIDCPSIPCNCYETKITENCDGVEIGYIDCSDNLVTFIGNKNETYSFCSKIVPSVGGCRPPLIFLLKGECIDGQCPQPTTTTTTTPITTTTTTLQPFVPIPIQPKNECDPLTIFPLGVECFNIDPTFSDTFDGVVGLGITGGTPPYTILWNTDSVAPAIFNVGVGEYTATVTDYYKDFTATTTCVLTAITTTTTTLPPTTTQKIYNDFCVIVSIRQGTEFEEKLFDLTYNGFYDGYPSWTSVTDNLFVYWSADTTNLWILNGFPNISVINNIYNEPSTGEPLPFNNWQVLGLTDPKIQIDVRVVPGPCSSVNEPTISVTKNNPTCGCNGSISIQVNGGTPPYQYSIDGGLSYQTNPVFQNLCSGGYSTFVKDSNDFVDSQFVILTQTTLVPITLSLQYTGPNSFVITTTPSLPPGITLNFNLTHTNSFTKQPATSTQTYNNVVTLTKNTIVVPSSVGPVITTTNLPVVGPCSILGKLKTDTNTTWQNVSIQTGDIITGTFTDVVSTLIPIPGCYIEPITSKNLFITLGSVDSCLQQYIIVNNPPSYSTAQITGPFIP